MVRVVRIVQALALILIAAYVLLLHNANPQSLALPGLIPMPPALVLVVSVAIAFLAGWLPPRIRLWRRSREIARLQRRIHEHEQHVPSYDRPEHAPVIPDRDAAQRDDLVERIEPSDDDAA